MDANTMHASQLRGQELYSADNKKIAKIEDVFLDDKTRVPEWLRLDVGTGFLKARKDVLVPVQAVSLQGDRLVVAYTSDKVKGAPNVNIEYISPEEERGLFNYYGIEVPASAAELNPDWGAPPDRHDMVEEVYGNVGAPPDRPGVAETPEQKVVAETGMADATHVRLRRWEETE